MGYAVMENAAGSPAPTKILLVFLCLVLFAYGVNGQSDAYAYGVNGQSDDGWKFFYGYCATSDENKHLPKTGSESGSSSLDACFSECMNNIACSAFEWLDVAFGGFYCYLILDSEPATQGIVHGPTTDARCYVKPVDGCDATAECIDACPVMATSCEEFEAYTAVGGCAANCCESVTKPYGDALCGETDDVNSKPDESVQTTLVQTTKPSLNFEYQVKDVQLNHCDQGLDETECEDLASFLGLSFTTESMRNGPKGCTIRDNDGWYEDEPDYDSVVFNTHATGGTIRVDSYLVCKDASDNNSNQPQSNPTDCSQETLQEAQKWRALVESLSESLGHLGRRNLKNVNDVFEVLLDTMHTGEILNVKY